jgi:drug/metabolite transporter (DMT)-like permease
MRRSFGVRAPAWALVAAAASWGLATVISKRAVEEVEPLTLLPIELAVSVSILATAAAVSHQGIGSSAELRRLGLLGVLNPGLSYALGLAGLALISASTSVLLWAAEPLLILLLAWLLLGHHVTRAVFAWSLLALGGVMLVLFGPGMSVNPVGVALTVAGVAACAIYTVLSSSLLVEAATLSVVFVQQVAAFAFSLLLFVGALAAGEAGSLSDVTATGWASAVAAGVLYYAVAFWFYVAALRRVRPAVAGMFLNLIPIFGLAASRLFLEERLTARQWAGAALIVAAVVAVARRRAHTDEGLASGRRVRAVRRRRARALSPTAARRPT